MNKLKTILIFLCLISLVHNSFLIRLSILTTGNPGAIPYGVVLFITIFLVIISTYSRTITININNLIISIMIFLMIGIVFFINIISNSNEYSILNAVVLRFPFLILFFVVFPANRMTFDVVTLKKLTSVYLAVNLVLGILQVLLNQTLVSVEYNQEPFVNTVFFKDGFSTKYSYILDYGGRIRAFALFDSGLSFGLMMLLFLSLSISKKKEHRSLLDNVKIFSIILGLFFSYTRNVYVVLTFFLLFFAISKFNKKISWDFVFRVGLLFQLAITVLSSSLFNDKILSSIRSIDISTLVSRGHLFQQALSQIKTPLDFLFGVGIQNVSTIDNDILYLIYYGGIITCIGVIFVYIYIMNICMKGFRRNAIDNAVGFFLMTYPIAATVNYVSNIYLVVCLFYYIYYMSSRKENNAF